MEMVFHRRREVKSETQEGTGNNISPTLWITQQHPSALKTGQDFWSISPRCQTNKQIFLPEVEKYLNWLFDFFSTPYYHCTHSVEI